MDKSPCFLLLGIHSLALHRAGQQTAHEEPLQANEDDQWQDHSDEGAGGDASDGGGDQVLLRVRADAAYGLLEGGLLLFLRQVPECLLQAGGTPDVPHAGRRAWPIGRRCRPGPC